MPATMRAAVFTAPEKIEIREVPRPDPGPGEIRIKLAGCGVCGSNVPVWEGRPWFQYPIDAGSPGHEGWGVVEAVGRDTHGLREGDRVAALSYRAYAEYDVAPASSAVRLPHAADGAAFPGEPLGCAVNVIRRAGIKRTDTVAVIGIGFLGALVTELASGIGARVIAISRREWSLDVARQAGAAETIRMDDHQAIIARVSELTNGAFCDCVIECVGLQWPLDLAAELTRERGRLVIAGYHQDGPRQINLQLWNWRGLDVINAHERDAEVYVDGMRRAIAAVTEGRLNPKPLLTHEFPLEQLAEAFEVMGQRPAGFLKAIVRT
jgi:threonine dehydrogenase-like Zn-dependent dehydrogenase